MVAKGLRSSFLGKGIFVFPKLLGILLFPKRRGAAWQRLEQMRRDGVNPWNSGARRAWIQSHRDELKPLWKGKAPGMVQEKPKTGRNDPCPCGSGKKYKKCHSFR